MLRVEHGVFGNKQFKPYTVTAVQDTVQIHEYLALKFDYETALGTRDFWAEAMWHTCHSTHETLLDALRTVCLRAVQRCCRKT